jgi:hypothetical protein
MPFSSQLEAKEFLVTRIALQAQREGQALSQMERRLLLYTVDQPESAEGIPGEIFFAYDPDFETRVRRLLDSAYRNAEPEEKNALVEAMRDVKKGDHYIAVMTGPALARATRARDILLYVLTGAIVVALSLLYSAYR